MIRYGGDSLGDISVRESRGGQGCWKRFQMTMKVWPLRERRQGACVGNF